MRYIGSMGDTPAQPSVPIPQLAAGQPLDPLVKAQLLAIAPNIPDTQAQDLLDFVDATKVGTSAKWMRIGMGAVGGLVVGFGLCKLLSR